MASAFTRLFSPSHRKRASNTSSSRRQDSTRPRFPTSSTFDLRHSIPEEASPATESTFPGLPEPTKLTVQHLNDYVSAPITDATLRRRSLAIDASHSHLNDTSRPRLPRSFSALDITSPSIDINNTSASSARDSPESTSAPPVDDDDDFDSNPLYLQLSQHPELSNDWNIASLAVIPLARTLTQHGGVCSDDLQDLQFVALHAFAPSKLYKHQFVSVRSLKHPSSLHTQPQSRRDPYDWNHVTLTATIESDQRSVSITETLHAPISKEDRSSTGSTSNIASTVKRKVAIVAETTIYRTVPAAAPVVAASNQSGFEVASRAHISSTETPAPSTKVRVISVNLPIVHRRTHSPGTSDLQHTSWKDISRSAEPIEGDDDVDTSISPLILDHITPERLFATDLVLLASPTTTSSRLAEALTNAFQMLFSAAHQFAASFVYVKGFDSYNAHRIRRGIWFKAWKAFEERLGSEHIARLSVEAFHRIKSLLENVVMGLVHTKMYGPIQDQLLDADLVADEVLSAYNAFNVTLSDFDVQNLALRQRPSRLEAAIDILSQGLNEEGGPELDEALSVGDVAMLREMLHQSASLAPRSAQSGVSDRTRNELGLATPPLHRANDGTARSELHRRTPLQILQTLRATIDEIGRAAERLHTSSSRGASSAHERPPPLGTDDLLPILSYVFVRARPSRLISMLYYARTFQLTDTATSPDLQWALVTCDAVITYLRSDPLRLCRRRSSSSIVVDGVRRGSHVQSGSSSVIDGLPVRSFSSRSHQGPAVSSSMQATMLMVRSPSANDGNGIAAATPPHSPLSPSFAIDTSTEHLSASESNSYFFRHGDASSEHVAYATSEASPRLQAEGFKLPGLPASVSSRRNSRILQPRPTSVFSLSEDGDTNSLLQDTSLDAHERRSSLAASQSPSRRLPMRERTFSSSSSSTTHNDVQIRPQIVRTIKRSQTGNLYTGSRLERTSSNGSTSSNSRVHVRVVGSPSTRAVESHSGSSTVFANGAASTTKADRRRSFDSWTAFSLFSSSGAPSGAADSNRSEIIRREPDHATDTSAGPAASSGWSHWKVESRSTSRRYSMSTGNTPSASAVDWRTVVDNAESDSKNCQPEGVEAPLPAAYEDIRMQRTPSARSNTSSQASGSDFGGGLQWPAAPEAATMKGSISSLPGTIRASQRRYRGRFLSTSSVGAPLPPKIDWSSMSAADLARPQRSHRQSIGSLNAIRASMDVSATGAQPQQAMSKPTWSQEDDGGGVPEMIPYGVDERGGLSEEAVTTQAGPSGEAIRTSPSVGLVPLFALLHLPSPVVEGRDPLEGSTDNVEAMSTVSTPVPAFAE
ncbi:hypothetical protein EX895_001342 [Sporisorium graminicola]|uniref:VPS9 domain-containing protein n=1 Tax=Sporisorium graminicola TaxID=280036 RepID=A0A4U7KZ37_9BASI|nr:hypothetical protein EX895_001342 [Sporisorium graminicola]TKY89557.1 hypothetical protein EX895_001342 [Sporisorium graminicola]